MTPPELARRWATSPESILEMIRRNELPAIRIGAGQKLPRWRIAISVIERIEQTGKATPPTATSGDTTSVANRIETRDAREAGHIESGEVGFESTSTQKRRRPRPRVPRYV